MNRQMLLELARVCEADSSRVFGGCRPMRVGSVDEFDQSWEDGWDFVSQYETPSDTGRRHLLRLAARLRRAEASGRVSPATRRPGPEQLHRVARRRRGTTQEVRP